MGRTASILLAALTSIVLTACGGNAQHRLQEKIEEGHAMLAERRYSDAMEAYSQAETKALKAGDPYSLGVIYRHMARIYMYMMLMSTRQPSLLPVLTQSSMHSMQMPLLM